MHTRTRAGSKAPCVSLAGHKAAVFQQRDAGRAQDVESARVRARTCTQIRAQEGWDLFVRKHGLCSSPHDPLRGRRVRRRQVFAARRSARGKASRTPVEPSHRCPRHRRELHRCVRMCTVRLPDSEKALPHSKHRYGRSPVCNLMCAVSLFADPKALPHVAQLSTRCSPYATCAPRPFASFRFLACAALPCRPWRSPSFVGGAGFEVRAAACPSLTGGTGNVLLPVGHTSRRR